jgi:uncharacterized protein with FMN-binding domain
MNPSPNNTKKIAGIIGLVVIVAAIAIGASVATKGKSDEVAKATATATASPTPSSQTLAATTTPAAAASAYKDGTYSAKGSYQSPGGQESVSVSVTLKGGVVSDSTVTTTGNNPTGKMYQEKFISGYKSQVTGKNIDDIQLSKVSGSSLTSGGFNNALEQIKTEAKA